VFARRGRARYCVLTCLLPAVKVFKNGRHFAAFLGLVPRQHSSGNCQQLLGISKHVDTYLRTLLIHEGRSALRVAHKKGR